PAGAAVLTFTTAANSTVQLSVAPTMRGRIMALYMLLLFGGTPLGGPMIGWLAAEHGGRAPIVLGGAFCFFAACVCGLLLARKREEPRTPAGHARLMATRCRARCGRVRRSACVPGSGAAWHAGPRCGSDRGVPRR